MLSRPICRSTFASLVGSRHSLDVGDVDEGSQGSPCLTGEGAGVVVCLSNDLRVPGGFLRRGWMDMAATSIRLEI